MAQNKSIDLEIGVVDKSTKTIDLINAALKRFIGVQEQLGVSGAEVNGSLTSFLQSFEDLQKRIKDLTTLKAAVAGMNDLERQQTATAASVDKTATKIDELKKRLAELQAADKPQQRSISAKEAQIERENKKLDEQKTKLAEINDLLSKSKTDVGVQAGGLGVTNVSLAGVNEAIGSSRAQQSQIRESVLSTNALIDAAQRLRAEVDPLAAVQDTYNRKLADATDLRQRGIISQELLTKAEKAYREEAERSTIAIQKQIAERDGSAAAARAAQQATEAQAAADKKQAAEAQNAAEANARAASRIKAEINPLAALYSAYRRELTEARRLQKEGALSADDLAKYTKKLREEVRQTAAVMKEANAEGKRNPFLGLRPYELNNLVYQLNDVFTQLGSGTPIMQVFAQQGGQIFQVFQRQLTPSAGAFGSSLIALGGSSLLAIGILGSLAAAFVNVADSIETARSFSGKFAATADNGLYDPEQIADLAHEMDVLGGSLDDARGALNEFTKAGVDPSKLEAYTKAAQDASKVTGMELPNAAARMVTAFRGGYEQVRDLDKELNFLTASELKQIKALYDAGKAEEARTLAFERFASKMDEGATKAKTTWGNAITSLSVIWDSFLKVLENSEVIQTTIAVLNALAQAANSAAAGIRGAASAAGQGGVVEQIARENAELKKRRDILAKNPDGYNFGRAAKDLQGVLTGNPLKTTATIARYATGNAGLQNQKEIDAIDRKIAANNERLNTLAKEGVGLSQQQLKIDQDALQAELDKGKEKAANTARAKAQIAYEQALKAAQDKGSSDQGSKAAAQAAYDRVYSDEMAKAQKKADKAGESAAKKAERSAEAARKKAEEYNAELTNRESILRSTIKAYDELGSAIGQSNGERYEAERAAELEKQVLQEVERAREAGVMLKDEEIRQYRDLVTAVYDLTNAEKRRAAALADQRAVDNVMRQDIQDYIGLVRERNRVVQDLNRELEAPVQDNKEIERLRTQLAELEKQIKSMGPAVEIALNGLKDPSISANVNKANSDMKRLAQTVAGSREATDALFSSATSGANELVDSLNEGQSAIESIGDAFRVFAADFLRRIAEMILQQTILNALGVKDAEGRPRQDGGSDAGDSVAGIVNAVLGRQSGAQAGASNGILPGENSTGAQKYGEEALNRWTGDVFARVFQVGGGLFGSVTSLLGGFFGNIFKGLGGAGGSGGNVFSGLASILAGVFHEGGIAGSATTVRAANPAWFNNAIRYHSGGIAGLKPNEVGAILQKGEEVLTTSDPRHRANGGSAAPNIKVVNTFDAGSFISEGLNSDVGQETFFNFVAANSGRLRTLLG